MSISSDTLFHFTDSIHNIISILTLTFCPKYCLEDFGIIFSPPFNIGEVAIPTVCFCDLPLSQTSTHLQFYGNYAIGMKKEWGIRNGINPIMYLCPDSFLAKHFHKLKTNAAMHRDAIDANFLFGVASFTKPYEGKMFRRGQYCEKRFYDEREWRYVPQIDFSDSEWVLSKERFMDENQLASVNSKVGNAHRLSFEPDDIKYIIVEKEQQILGMIDAIERIKGRNYDSNTVKILSSRIISAKQIEEDF